MRVDWLAEPEAASIIEATGAAVVVVTLLLVGRQIRLQRADLEFRIYQQINDRYSDLLWRAVEDPSLDSVWKPLTPEESDWIASQASSDEIASGHSWAVWAALAQDPNDCTTPPPFDLETERKLYRMIRAVLELCEQAYFAQSKNSIQPETWDKFEHVLATWTGSRYFDAVFGECQDRFTKPFTQEIQHLLERQAG